MLGWRYVEPVSSDTRPSRISKRGASTGFLRLCVNILKLRLAQSNGRTELRSSNEMTSASGPFFNTSTIYLMHNIMCLPKDGIGSSGVVRSKLAYPSTIGR